MRDEIVRIILEAKDKMSGVVGDAERNVNRSLGNMEKGLSNLDKSQERYSNNWRRRLADEQGSVRIWGDALERKLKSVQSTLSKTRKEFERTNIAFGKVERGPGGRFQSVAERREAERQTQGPGAFASFREGLREARRVEQQIRSQIAESPKDLKIKRLDLDNEIARLREIEIQFGNIVKETTARIAQQNRDTFKTFEGMEKTKEASRELDRKQRLEEATLARQIEFDKRKTLIEEAKRSLLEKRDAQYRVDLAERERAKIRAEREVRRSDLLSADEKKDRLQEIREEFRERQAFAIQQRNADRREIERRTGLINDKNQDFRKRDIAILEAANREEREKDSAATDKRIQKEKDGTRDIITDLNNQTTKDLRARRQSLEEDIRRRRIALSGQGEGNVVTSALNERELRNVEKDTNRVSAAFKNAGTSLGDLRRGFRRGRSDFQAISRAAREGDTAFAKFGQTVGRFTKNIGNMVNLRWYLLITFVQILGQAVVVLAANLVSLASSAALAAAALGAGLVAAVGQAIPVVGLLYAAFSRVGAAFTAAQQATKAGAQSSQDARAQAEAQTAAQQRLTDALYNQVQAVQQLADARRQARRDIVDSINAEIDANYALKDAEFALLDAKQRLYDLEHQDQQNKQDIKDAQAAVDEAKQRLAAAKKEGDQAEIENAQVQLAQAQQNLADVQGQEANQKDRKRQIDEQKLAVKEAEQQVKEAKIAQQRQQEDTARTLRLGVKGNQQVVAALHGVAQANREVADAQRGVTDASKKQASAGNVLQRQLSQLDPAERALYKAFRRIRETFKRIFRPITDIIVRAVTDAVNRFNIVLQDPKIARAFRGLAVAIAKGIRELTRYFSSKGFINSFIGLIHESIQNIPTLIKIIENLTKAFLGLAKAGAPVVTDLLGGFQRLTGRFARAINKPVGRDTQDQPGGARFTGQRQTQGQAFIAGAKTYLDAWLKLAGAIGRVFRYLFTDAAPSGKGLVADLTIFFNHIADFLRDNPQKVHRFFQNMRADFKGLAAIAGSVIKVLFGAFTGSDATAFAKFTAEVILPGLAALIKFLGVAAKVALFLTNIPGLGSIIKIVLQFLVFEKALNRIFPATQHVTNGLKKLFGLLLKGELFKVIATRVGFVIQMFKNWYQLLGFITKRALTALVTFVMETVIPALIAMGEAMYAALGPWGLLAIAIGAIIIVVYKFRHQILAALEYVWNWIKDHWKILAVILFGPFGLLIIAIVKWRHKIIGFFEDVINWIKNNWKKIAHWIEYPFIQTWNGLKWFFNKIKDAFTGVINWVRDHWKMLVHWLIDPYIKAFEWIKDWGGRLVHWFAQLPGKIVHALAKLPGMIFDLFKGLGKKIGKEIFSWVPQKLRGPLSKALGFAKDTLFGAVTGGAGGFIRDHLPATGGVIGSNRIPRGTGPHGTDTVPAWLTPGEWVLNKTQQLKLAQRLKETTGQVSAYLFGTNIGKNKPGPQTTGTRHKKTHAVQRRDGKLFHLVEQTDDNGNNVWFIELDDASYAEVTKRDAAHIMRSHGNWIPKYVKRARDYDTGQVRGFTQKGQRALKKRGLYSGGGIVIPQPSFAMGGIVTSPQNTYGVSNIATRGVDVHHKKVEQNFKVHTQGETDWNYVMRLAAMHAESSF